MRTYASHRSQYVSIDTGTDTQMDGEKAIDGERDESIGSNTRQPITDSGSEFGLKQPSILFLHVICTGNTV